MSKQNSLAVITNESSNSEKLGDIFPEAYYEDNEKMEPAQVEKPITRESNCPFCGVETPQPTDHFVTSELCGWKLVAEMFGEPASDGERRYREHLRTTGVI
jgi:hypothetical protein